MQMQLVYLGAAIGGVALAGAAVWAAWRFAKAKPAPEPVEMEIVFEERPASVARPGPAAPASRAPPPPASARSHPERAPAMVLTQGVRMQDSEFSRRAAPIAPSAPSAPPPRVAPMKSWAQQVRETSQAEVPTEWARRQVGPVEPGRVAGACGGCGARLSVSDQRPLRIACPVCGRQKLIA